jgi:WD40 repeat protein
MSYSNNEDSYFVKHFQTGLHQFAKPWFKLRALRLFRDQTDLAADPDLWKVIESSLSESEFLLLFASPESAKSKWVNKEISWWLANNTIKKLIIILTKGQIKWNDTANDFDWTNTDAISQSLSKQFNAEPKFIDCRKIKYDKKLKLSNSSFKNLVLDVAAPLHKKTKDVLWNQDLKLLKQNRIIAFSAATVGVALLALAIVSILSSRNNKRIAESNRLASQLVSQAEIVAKHNPADIAISTSLAVKALRIQQSLAADQVLYKNLQLLGPKPYFEKTYTGYKDVYLSSSGKYIVKLPWDGPAVVELSKTGEEILSLQNKDYGSGKTTRIIDATFNSNDSIIATLGSLGASVAVWGLPNGKLIFETPLDKGGIISCTLSPSGKYLVTGHADSSVVIWQIDNGSKILNIKMADRVQKLSVSSDDNYLALCTGNGNFYGSALKVFITLWDIKNKKELSKLKHESAVTDFSFSPDGQYLASTCRIGFENENKVKNGIVTIWNTDKGNKLCVIQSDKSINSFMFSRDNKYLLTGSSDNTSKFWEVKTGKELMSINTDKKVDRVGMLKAIEYSNSFITTGEDGLVRLWAAFTPVEEQLRLFQNLNIQSLRYNRSDKFIATLSYDVKDDAKDTSSMHYKRYLRIWNIADIKKRLPLEHENIVIAVKFSSDAKYIASLSSKSPEEEVIPATKATSTGVKYINNGYGSVSIWNSVNRERLALINHPGTIWSYDFDSTGKYIVTGCIDGIVRVYDALKGNLLAKLENSGWVLSVAFNKNAQYIALANSDPDLISGKAGYGTIKIWDWKNNQILYQDKKTCLVTVTIFNKDGNIAIFGGFDGIINTVFLPDKNNMQKTETINVNSPVLAIAIDPNAKNIILGTGGSAQTDKNGIVQKGYSILYNLIDQKYKVLKEHTSWVTGVDFSADGKHFGTIDQNGTATVWNMNNLMDTITVKHNETNVEARIHFNKNDSLFITSFDKLAQVWDIKTGNEIVRREHSVGYLWDAQFSPDGKYIATASTDCTVRLWLWQAKDMEQDACECVSGLVTNELWERCLDKSIPYSPICSK